MIPNSIGTNAKKKNFFIIFIFFCASLSPPFGINEYKIKVWELYLLYPNVRLLALPLGWIKQ